MTITINQLSSGMGLNIDGQVYLITEYHHVKPGKGAAFVRVKLKNIKTEQVLERTFRSADKLEEANLEEKRLNFLYRAADAFHFMDHESYEEIVIPEEELGDVPKFLLDDLQVTGIYHDHKVLKVLLPTFIVAQITEAEPGFKGDTSRSGTKPVAIPTGTTMQVPLFINKGDWIKIDTRTGEYVERVQK